MAGQHDDKFLDRAVALAMRGRGGVEPNPMVGCVIVRDGGVIGEGWHERVGGAHAEPNALADCAARGNSARGSTAYVTLEPCCHVAKRTPPCVPAVIAAGISRVVVGCLDPNPAVNGEGVRQLREAGVEVEVVSEESRVGRACRQLIGPFVARTVIGRPFVTVKWAEDGEGRIAGVNGARRQISGEAAMAAVHRLRGLNRAVMVGGETVRKDDPMLTVRLGPLSGAKPVRVVVSGRLDLPSEAKLLQSPEEGEVLVYTTGELLSRVRIRAQPGITYVAAGEREVDLEMVLRDLLKRGVWEVLVESGGRLAAELVKRGLADRAWVFKCAKVLGEDGPRAAEMDLRVGAEVAVGEDRLVEMWNPKSPVFAGVEASADVVRLRGA